MEKEKHPHQRIENPEATRKKRYLILFVSIFLLTLFMAVEKCSRAYSIEGEFVGYSTTSAEGRDRYGKKMTQAYRKMIVKTKYGRFYLHENTPTRRGKVNLLVKKGLITGKIYLIEK